MFEICMIVFSKNEKRLNNYRDVKSFIPDLQYFEAIDSINDYENVAKLGIEKGYVTNRACNYHANKYKGKLGCNLSHLMLLEQFKGEWLLVLEDDVSVKGYSRDFVEELIKETDSLFINLCINHHFLEEQNKASKISSHLSKLVHQWGTYAYLINRKAIDYVLANPPTEEYIDLYYCRLIDRFRSAAYVESLFLCEGCASPVDKGKTKFESLILDS